MGILYGKSFPWLLRFSSTNRKVQKCRNISSVEEWFINQCTVKI